MRCVSQVQSYNIYDSKDYFDAYGNNWLQRAEMILNNPYLEKPENKNEEIQIKSSEHLQEEPDLQNLSDGQ